MKGKRSKSQSNVQLTHHQCKLIRPKEMKHANQGQSRRCQCCNQRIRYPDYLAELRRQRLQKMEKKMLAEAFMQSPIPLIESKNISQEIVSQFLPEDHTFISKMSNKVSQYEQTPKKSVLQSFHQSIIKSHSKKSVLGSIKNEGQKNQNMKSKEQNFRFEITLQNVQNGELFYRNFSAVQYGVQAVKCIQQILVKAIK